MASGFSPNSQGKDTPRNRLPFEPTRHRPKPSKTQSPVAATPPKTGSQKKTAPSLNGIPEVVSGRMVRRMAIFSGIPTGLGIASFFISYLVVTQGWFPLPHVAVLLVSMGLFGLGVVGLTYGALSASWDEQAVGSTLGWTEFKTNLGRTVAAWRTPKGATKS